MSVEIAMNTPLAEALNNAIQPKLVEVGWSTGSDDGALSEYIILMLVNGKTQEQIASELSGDLLSLGPDDPGANDFARWLFEQINSLNAQINGAPAAASESQDATSMSLDQDTDMNSTPDVAELNAPTGPKSMRNGSGNMRGNRDKRMFGQMNKAMDRTHDSVLHRVRGTSGTGRINSHDSRGPPTGPRAGPGRGNNRGGMGARTAALQAGLQNLEHPGFPSHPAEMNFPPGGPNWMMQAGMQGANGGDQSQIFNLLQQQNQMMAQLSQQLQQQQGSGGRGGRSLFDRTQRGNNRRGGHGNGPRSQHHKNNGPNSAEGDGQDVDMTNKEPPNPETSVCKYNLSCTNKDCKFAHQSPAARPGVTVDVNDVCSFGAACKNFKCVGRHPSPAAKRGFQGEQDCKFYPNCTNPKCPFRHPDMPVCRNGADCSTEGCKFTHLQTSCKYKPCTNRYCPYKHEEGQRGTYQDKVWTADGADGHVSDRKFVDNENEEMVVAGQTGEAESGATAMDDGIA